MIHLLQNPNLQLKADYSEEAVKTKQVLRVEWQAGHYPSDSLLQEIRRHKMEILIRVNKETLQLSSAFAKSLAVIATRNKPRFISQKYWDPIILSIPKLFMGDTPWLRQMIDHGWTVEDIFGCHPISPENRYDYMGFLLLLPDKMISGVSRDVLTVTTGTGAVQTYRQLLRIHPDQMTLALLPDDKPLSDTVSFHQE